ncbi:hypothetical protein R3X27_10815 [Tropicimonas sp. TH_r6]|uniref:hypothetical protein n=1 Tax=Tropicimonas sp. TH_r6 TaxID=3082085 RepID=UPI0029546206|nr:hypothetical protein [Tropicimonas sp. TH_r6]MDV7143174.1 hypothetical protein [Tropicimonas sp. TH_r6]
MSKVLTRFETALGARYEDVNPIKLGTHGNRIIRLSTTAGETLAEDDVAELQEFAAAIALFLERFPEWRAYRDPTPEETFSPEVALHLAETVRELAGALKDLPEMDPAISASLEEQAQAVAEMAEDAVTAKGQANSASNVVSAVAEILWKGAKACGVGVATFAKMVVEKSTELVATGLAGAALDILANNAALLRSLAASNPQTFDWILEVLKRLGL